MLLSKTILAFLWGLIVQIKTLSDLFLFSKNFNQVHIFIIFKIILEC